MPYVPILTMCYLQSGEEDLVDKFNKTSINSAEDVKTRQKRAEKLKQEGNMCFEKVFIFSVIYLRVIVLVMQL